MNKLLCENGDFNYYVADTFESKMLVPVIKNHFQRPESEWNDWSEYNEVYSCLHFIEMVRENTDVTLDFHYIHKGKSIVGFGIIIHGVVSLASQRCKILRLVAGNEQIGLFNCLYTSPEGREEEEYWLKDIILPHYRLPG